MKVLSLIVVCASLFIASSVAAEPSDESIYQTTAKWTTQKNAQLELKEFSGNPVVLAMAYTSCQYSCPLTIALMKKVQGSIPAAKRSKVHFVLVSLDPELDTPETMMQFTKKSGLDSASWTLLNGAPDDVRELAVLLGIKYQKTTSGDINHSAVVAVLDSSGRIVKRREGLGGDGEELSAALLPLL